MRTHLRTHLFTLTTAVLIAGLSHLARGADLLDEWTWRNPLPTGNDLFDVTYGNGIYVTVGDFGAILTSPDGTNWTPRVTRATSGFLGVAYASGQFVAVGNGGTIHSSPDGITWTERASGTTRDLWNVVWGDGCFLAVGDSATVVTSPDGITWSASTAGTATLLRGVAYGDGVYVAVGGDSSGVIRTSTNGVNWTARGTSKPPLFGVGFGGGLFVALGINGTILTSSNGINWTARLSGTTSVLFDTAYANRLLKKPKFL